MQGNKRDWRKNCRGAVDSQLAGYFYWLPEKVDLGTGKHALRVDFGIGKYALRVDFSLGKYAPRVDFSLGKYAPRVDFGIGKYALRVDYRTGKYAPRVDFSAGKYAPRFMEKLVQMSSKLLNCNYFKYGNCIANLMPLSN
mgnify:CR=1 FL=1